MKRLAAGVLSLAVLLLAACSPVPAGDDDGGSPSAASAPVPSPARLFTSEPPESESETETETETVVVPDIGARLAALVGEPGGSPAEVVLLGDSFAAGEGAGSYGPVDGVADSLCHRSAEGLMSQAAGSAVLHNFACSRARISDLNSAQQMDGHGAGGLPAQLDQMGGLSPDLVLLSIGGNDAGFANLLQACIVDEEPCSADASLRLATDRLLRDLREPLTQLYAELGTAMSSPVLVLPYPRLFDPSQEACGRLAPEELSFGRHVTDALNSTIEESVRASGQPNVRYVDALEDSFATRGACSPDPLVVTARLGSLLNAATSVSAAQEVLHPTGEGYEVLSRDLLEWMEKHPMEGRGTAALEAK